MKIIIKIIAYMSLFIALTIALSACAGFKYSIYETALNYEYGKADLSVKHLALNGKSIALLESPADPTKPNIVLIHGFGANKENWVRFAAHLTENYHVVAIDLPGHGESSKDLDLRYDIDDQVGYVHEILKELKIQRFHLAGNSMGGAISSLYAATYPEEVLSLWLFNPGGIYTYESEFNRLVKEGKNPLIVNNTDDFDQLMDFAMEKKPFIIWPITSVMAEKALKNKAINQKIFSDIHGNHQYVFQKELKKIKAPTLILWGSKDRILDVGNASVFEELISGSRKIIFEEVGHLPMVEIPEESAMVCKDFVEGM